MLETRNHLRQPRIETRKGAKPRLIGCASVFYDGTPGTEYILYQDLVERIDPHAFDRTLREEDIRALWNHNADYPLGRVKAGTLSFTVDKIGLWFEVELPDTQIGRDVHTSIDRGDVTGCSFGFAVRKQLFVTQKTGPDLRIIQDVELREVSPVTFPAYTSTEVIARAETRRGPLSGFMRPHAA